MIQFETMIQQFKNFCIYNLKRHYNGEESLFCFREFLEPRRVESHLSYRYSIIAMLGLIQHKNHSAIEKYFNLDALIENLVQKSSQCDLLSDLGLLLWLDAQYGARYSDIILKRIAKLKKMVSIRTIVTYELAWLLTGLSYTLKKRPDLESSVWLDFNDQVYQELSSRYHLQTYLFYHASEKDSQNRIRRKISDFADQVYSIYANACYHELNQNQQALQIAVNCGRKIVNLQGPNGEWWWLYHAEKGHVAYRYPVYSVHQDGMGPMVLMKLAEVTRENWKEPIDKSFRWLFINNGHERINFNSHKIIRGERILPSYLKHIAVALSLCHLDFVSKILIYPLFRDVGIINEFRPYHLGWILYFLGYWERAQIPQNETV